MRKDFCQVSVPDREDDINEYKPVTHHCCSCHVELDDEDEVFEIEQAFYVCEECFVQHIHDNMDAYDLAKAFEIPVMKVCEI